MLFNDFTYYALQVATTKSDSPSVPFFNFPFHLLGSLFRMGKLGAESVLIRSLQSHVSLGLLQLDVWKGQIVVAEHFQKRTLSVLLLSLSLFHEQRRRERTV